MYHFGGVGKDGDGGMMVMRLMSGHVGVDFFLTRAPRWAVETLAATGHSGEKNKH